jgi:hypothetical protein
MDPRLAGGLADALLLVHAGIVVAVTGLLPLILLGGRRGWRWVRHRGLRLTHLLLMLYIAATAWIGALCPLTVWEQALRRRAGQPAYGESFIEHWLGELLYIEAPWWAFVAGYTLFAALLVLAWWRVPPRRD